MYMKTMKNNETSKEAPMNRNTFYSVTFVDADGNTQFSSTFQTIKAARSWVRWLSSSSFASNPTIWAGQPGGMRVA